jgi:hypothetical protein
MNSKRFWGAFFCTTLALALFVYSAWADGEKKEAQEAKKATPQTTCPIMGGKIVKDLFVDHGGKRIYLCCKACIAPVSKNPEKFIKQLEAKGITLAKTPPALCHKCGEIKGAEECCKIEGREKCKKCNLFKGSPGCCKLTKEAKGPVPLCTKCGEIKGAEACCRAEGREKCEKCNLLKGSPGCCKIEAAHGKEAGHKHHGKAAPMHKVKCTDCPAGKDKGACTSCDARKAGKAKAKAAGCCGGCGGK